MGDHYWEPVQVFNPDFVRRVHTERRERARAAAIAARIMPYPRTPVPRGIIKHMCSVRHLTYDEVIVQGRMTHEHIECRESIVRELMRLYPQWGNAQLAKAVGLDHSSIATMKRRIRNGTSRIRRLED